jgi:hypothetical protein
MSAWRLGRISFQTVTDSNKTFFEAHTELATRVKRCTSMEYVHIFFKCDPPDFAQLYLIGLDVHLLVIQGYSKRSIHFQKFILQTLQMLSSNPVYGWKGNLSKF